MAGCLVVAASTFNDFGSFGVEHEYRIVLSVGNTILDSNQEKLPGHFSYKESSEQLLIKIFLQNTEIACCGIKIAQILAESDQFCPLSLKDPINNQSGLEGMVILQGKACNNQQHANPSISLKSQSSSNIADPKSVKIISTSNTYPQEVYRSNFSEFTFEKVTKRIAKDPRASFFASDLEKTYVAVNLSPTISAGALFDASETLRDVKLFMGARGMRVTGLLEFAGDGFESNFLDVIKRHSVPGFRLVPSKFTFREVLNAERRLSREQYHVDRSTIWELKNQLAAFPARPGSTENTQVDVLSFVRNLQNLATELQNRNQRIEYEKFEFLENWKREAVKKMNDIRNEELVRKLLEQERRDRQNALDQKTYPCAICYEDYLIADIYVLDGCNHKYCKHCLKQYIITKIDDGNVLKLLCPESSCEMELHLNEVKHLVPHDVFEKFDRFLIKSTLESMGDVQWCPKAGCGNPMIADRGTLMLVCPSEKCHFSFCTRCQEEWHSDATCEEYQTWKIENNEAEARYQQWVKKNARKCPNCPAVIEKNGGCNHMTCKGCKHEYCWLCMKPYKSGHFNNSGCKQFS